MRGRVTGTVKDTIIVAMTLFRPRPVRLDRTQSPLQWCIPGTHTRETHQNNIKRTRRISRRVGITTTFQVFASMCSPILITRAGDSRLIYISMCIRRFMQNARK